MEWHPGFVLPLARIPVDVPATGAEVFAWEAFCAQGRARRLAAQVAGDASGLDTAKLGAAAASIVRHPERWDDWADPLQYLKYLWRMVVAYGVPR